MSKTTYTQGRAVRHAMMIMVRVKGRDTGFVKVWRGTYISSTHTCMQGRAAGHAV